jgi:hypothetical protein
MGKTAVAVPRMGGGVSSPQSARGRIAAALPSSHPPSAAPFGAAFCFDAGYTARQDLLTMLLGRARCKNEDTLSNGKNDENFNMPRTQSTVSTKVSHRGPRGVTVDKRSLPTQGVISVPPLLRGNRLRARVAQRVAVLGR